ncbi:MAG: alpha/beta fold hydrolase [Caulobacteraceae bacterium]
MDRLVRMNVPSSYASFDGARIALHTLGDGRPTIMLHGFLANAQSNWFGPGIAQLLAAEGRQVIAPDLRGHGQSAALPASSHDWPGDVLVDDQLCLIERLGLADYDLVGYSLGARTAARMMVRGARPARCVLGGMGASGILEAGDRADMFEDAIRNGENAKDPRAGRRIQRMLTEGGLSAEAMLGVIASFVPTTWADLAGIPVPTLVVSGLDDHDNGSPEDLARVLPRGAVVRVSGNHLSAVTDPALARAIADFLDGDLPESRS